MSGINEPGISIVPRSQRVTLGCGSPSKLASCCCDSRANWRRARRFAPRVARSTQIPIPGPMSLVTGPPKTFGNPYGMVLTPPIPYRIVSQSGRAGKRKPDSSMGTRPVPVGHDSHATVPPVVERSPIPPARTPAWPANSESKARSAQPDSRMASPYARRPVNTARPSDRGATTRRPQVPRCIACGCVMTFVNGHKGSGRCSPCETGDPATAADKGRSW